MSEITSFAQLGELRAKILALPAVPAKIAARVAPAFSALAQQAFAGHQSPYGDAWAPGVDLVESGALRDRAIRYTAEGGRVRATIGAVKYARYQLKQGILPKAGALPSAWYDQLKSIADDELEKALVL